MGKITVKHYLNKRLKPEVEKFGKKTYLYYPLYVSLTVNKKNIRFRSHINADITEDEFENKSKEYKRYANFIKYESDLLTSITELLLNDIANNSINNQIIKSFFGKQKSKDNFISLLNSYIDCYRHCILDAVDYYCYDQIEKDVYSKLEKTFRLDKHNRINEVFKFRFPNSISLTDFIKQNLSDYSLKMYYIVESLRHFLSPYALKTDYDIPYLDWLNNKMQPMYRDFLLKSDERFYKLYGVKATEQVVNSAISIIDDVVRNHFIEYTELFREKHFYKSL